MTDPRKTPRTDVRTWKTATGETVVFASVAQDLEIETQELAELVETLLNVAENADETGYVTDCGYVDIEKFHEEARALLARHRAKQEVQS